MDQLPFPEIIDSTMLADFRACQRSWYWRYLRKRAQPGESVDLIAGGAFARGLEVARRLYWEHGQPPETCLAAGIGAALKEFGDPDIPEKKMAKNWDRVIAALESYFEHYPLDKDYLQPVQTEGRYMIEFSFAQPLPILHPVTGNPLILAGRADQIVQYHGSVFVEDEKTTSQLGESWSDKWDMRAQFACYTWAAQQVGIPVVGTIVRGVGFYKTYIGHAEAIIYQEPWKVQRWYEQTLHNLNEMIDCWREGRFGYNLGDTCTAYSGCPYKFLCTKQDPEPWLETYYVEHDWNPITRGGKKDDHRTNDIGAGSVRQQSPSEAAQAS